MKKILVLLLGLYVAPALADDLKVNLLNAWETLQENSPDVAEFRKLSDKKYWIKFVNLPYEGELKVLAYDTEELSLGVGESPYRLTGYIEVDLVDTTAEEMAKYSRTYSKWVQSNSFFYNQETETWDTFKTYREKLMQETEDLAPSSWLLMLFEYSEFLLFAILFYFIFTAFTNDRRVKKAMVLQQKAMDDFEVTRRFMKEGMLLHRETNRLLELILAEQKGKPEDSGQ